MLCRINVPFLDTLHIARYIDSSIKKIFIIEESILVFFCETNDLSSRKEDIVETLHQRIEDLTLKEILAQNEEGNAKEDDIKEKNLVNNQKTW